ncbi:metallophosphoesterase [Anaeromicropila herbilytica]|uniref:Phosphoesterase n=1 Tax=Anaeromicropila herbilytica TaxID=2785025 RepID=A0A7R7IEQ2_9FIRM|nr:phosphoesterase [Anaeromicropila herbilytica]
MSKRVRRISLLIILLMGIPLFLIWQNNDIVITKFTYRSSKIGRDFDGYKIAQISDLHNKQFGNKQKRLIEHLRGIHPDLIVVTGDIIDANRTNVDITMEFIRGAMKIAPIYYVSGNHEAWSGRYNELLDKLIKEGVIIMDDKSIEIQKNDTKIYLIGLSDPDFLSNNIQNQDRKKQIDQKLKKLALHENELQILLSHRPELIQIYAKNNIDIAFTGHAHGGQFRIPYISGLYAPNQGFFPKYSSGAYKMSKTTMFVSRGLGNSKIPFRIFNRPEIIVLNLEKEK